MMRVKRPGRPVRNCQHVQQPCVACAPGSYMMVKIQMRKYDTIYTADIYVSNDATADGSCCCQPSARNPAELARQAEQLAMMAQHQQSPYQAHHFPQTNSHSTDASPTKYSTPHSLHGFTGPMPNASCCNAQISTASLLESGFATRQLSGESLSSQLQSSSNIDSDMPRPNGKMISLLHSTTHYSDQTDGNGVVNGNNNLSPLNGSAPGNSFANSLTETRDGYDHAQFHSHDQGRERCDWIPSAFGDSFRLRPQPSVINSPLVPEHLGSRKSMPFSTTTYPQSSPAMDPVQFGQSTATNQHSRQNFTSLRQGEALNGPQPVFEQDPRLCGCGPGCQCLYCSVHPYNTANQKLVEELTRTMEEDGVLYDPVLSRPQSQNASAMHPNASFGFSSIANHVISSQSMLPEGISQDERYSTLQYEIPGACARNECQCGDGCQCADCTTHPHHI